MKKVFFLLIGLCLAYGCESNNRIASQKPLGPVGAKEAEKDSWGNAPDFTLSALQNIPLTLSQYKGKVIILDFWATWCKPCRLEIPGFIELYEKYREKGLMVIGVSLDRSERKVKQFARDFGINYPLVMGNRKLVQKYGGFRGIPTTFIIDQNGDIKNKFTGYRSKDVFEKEINKYLN